MTAAFNLATCPAWHVIEATVLGVYWMHDDYAGEQGYGLHYQASQGFSGVTLLADERSENDAPLYVGDTVRLRPIGHRRHTIVDNLTLLRDVVAARVDWVKIALAPPVSPAQLLAPPPAGDEGVSKTQEEALARKHPEIASALDQLLARKREAQLRADSTNGGW